MPSFLIADVLKRWHSFQMEKAKQGQVRSRRATRSVRSASANDRLPEHAFRNSFAWQRLVSLLNTLRWFVSLNSDLGATRSSSDKKKPQEFVALRHEAEQLLSQFGDSSPVTAANIYEFVTADPEKVTSTQFAHRLAACGEAIDRVLAAIPAGLDKSRLGAREAFLLDPSLPLAALLARHPEGADLADLTEACDPVRARHPETLLAAMFTLDLALPRSANFTAAVENFLDAATAAAAYADGTHPRHQDLPLTADTHWLLNLAPRRPQLMMPLFASMRALVHSLVPFQSPLGYWASSGETPKRLIFYSAGIAHSLAVFGDRRAPETEAALRNVFAWLEEVQRADGGWAICANDSESDVVTTAFVADLLRRAGYQSCYNRAAKFLWAQQHSAGLWSSTRGDADAHSAIVFEVLEGRLSLFPEFDHRLSLTRDLFAKAYQLVRAEDEISDQIALIAAHQAVEMLLYSALEALEPPGITWEANGQRTVGLRVALANLNQCLIEKGGEALNRKSQMQTLASARDGIVHKGTVVARSAVREHLDETQKFFSATSLRVLGFDLLG